MNYLPDAFTTCFTILSYSVLDILETLPCFFRTSNCSSTYFLAASLMLPLFCVCDICLFPPGFFKDRKSTRLNSSHSQISYAVFCLKKKQKWLSALLVFVLLGFRWGLLPGVNYRNRVKAYVSFFDPVQSHVVVSYIFYL